MVGSWTSRKGQERLDNRDAGGLFVSTQSTLAIVLDASERGPHGAYFAQHWVRHVLDAAAALADATAERLIELMRAAHRDLRMQYPAEVACYGALLVRHDLHRAWALNCGDCRIGVRQSGMAIEWLTPVHTIANMQGELFTVEHARSEERHVVTRVLNAKRFVLPDIVELSISTTARYVLATDGYWIEDMLATRPELHGTDDASVMILTFPPATSSMQADCDNWYVITR